MHTNNGKNLRRMTMTALFMALVTVTTLLIGVPVPATQGYINIGDTAVFLAALVGGPQIGLIAGGFGSALADVIGGYAHWAPWTLVIKGLEGLIVGWLAVRAYRRQGPFAPRVLLGMGLGVAFMVVGYYLAGGLMKGFAASLTEIPGNLIQGSVSIVLALPLLAAMRALNLHGPR